jgi:lambda repressor-like predicted transcriptional regulator
MILPMTHETPNFEIPKEPAHRRAWVLYQLKIRGLSLRKLGKEWGMYPQSIAHALMAPSFHTEIALAKVIDLTPQQLFPERFDAAGRRLHCVRHPNLKTPGENRNVKDSMGAST